jgi:hypothetical protein
MEFSVPYGQIMHIALRRSFRCVPGAHRLRSEHRRAHGLDMRLCRSIGARQRFLPRFTFHMVRKCHCLEIKMILIFDLMSSLSTIDSFFLSGASLGQRLRNDGACEKGQLTKVVASETSHVIFLPLRTTRATPYSLINRLCPSLNCAHQPLVLVSQFCSSTATTSMSMNWAAVRSRRG